MVKYDSAFVMERIQTTVNDLKQKGILNDDVIYVVMMNGGVWFAVHLFDCLESIHNQVYFVKAHSYQDAQQNELVWDYFNLPDIEGKDIVVLDDICDTGNTSRAILRKLEQSHPHSVRFVTLLTRTSTDTTGLDLTSCIVDDSKDFFYGCGLDSHGNHDRFCSFIGICK